jgi:hypothetical protein
MVGKISFTSKKFLLYSPQKDRSLSTSKKERKNMEEAIGLIPQKNQS